MKIVICGAGQVGASIASHLSVEDNDITLIDQNGDLVKQVTEMHNARGVIGNPSHPDILANAKVGEADMLIAVTPHDEINMIACQVAHSIYRTPLKIARIHTSSYLDQSVGDLYSPDNLPIDHIISPESEVSDAVLRRLKVPGAFDVGSMCDDKIRIIGVRCLASCPILGATIRYLVELFDDLNMTIIAILRGTETIVPRDGSVKMEEGDQVYFVCDEKHLPRAMASFGHEEPESRKILLAGGGNIARQVAEAVHSSIESSQQTIIEGDKQTALDAKQHLPPGITVISGNALDPDILIEGGVNDSDTFVAVTNNDEVNVLSSLLARRFGAAHVVSLINMPSFIPLMATLGVDSVINPPAITASIILEHVRRGRVVDVYKIIEERGEVLEVEAQPSSPLVGTPLKQAKLPKHTVVGAVVHDGDFIAPRGNTVIQPGDRVVLFAARGAIAELERILAVRAEFF